MPHEIEFPEELWGEIHALPKEADEPLAEAMILLGRAVPDSGPRQEGR